MAKAKHSAKAAKQAQKDLNQKIKEQAATLKHERTQFRKWRHTHKQNELAIEMDSAMGRPNSTAKKEQVNQLILRFKQEVLERPNKETYRRSVAKMKNDFNSNKCAIIPNELIAKFASGEGVHGGPIPTQDN